MLRECLILMGISLQAHAEHQTRATQTTAGLYAPSASAASLRKAGSEINRELWRLHQVALMDVGALVRKGAKGSVDAFAKLYQALQKTKFFDMIREMHFNINPEERTYGG